MSQFKEGKQSTSKHCKEPIQSIRIDPCKSLPVSSLTCKQPLAEREAAVPALRIAVARLTCGQQRERLTQVSNAQGHPGIFTPTSVFPQRWQRVVTRRVCCCCYPSYAARKQAHRVLLVITVMPLICISFRKFLQKPDTKTKCFAPGVHEL